MEKERKKRIEAINHESPSDQPELARGSEAFHKGLASLYSHHLQCSATLVVCVQMHSSITYPHQGEPRSPSDLAPSALKGNIPRSTNVSSSACSFPVGGTAFCSCGLTESFL